MYGLFYVDITILMIVNSASLIEFKSDIHESLVLNKFYREQLLSKCNRNFSKFLIEKSIGLPAIYIEINSPPNKLENLIKLQL